MLSLKKIFPFWLINTNSYRVSNRKIIEPQEFTTQKIDEFHLVKSQSFEFLISRLPDKKQIYRHEIDTPANVLKKPCIHIFRNEMPEINKKQKYEAVQRKLKEHHWEILEKINDPQELFHMNRKLKHELKIRLDRIGSVEGKYKHYMLFKPYSQTFKERTRQQYQNKGVQVECLGFKIYPKGDIWMPTNEKYLAALIEKLKGLVGDREIKNIFDIGCGSGVLSLLAAKSFKKATVVSIDTNQSAVDTCNITAATNNLENVYAYQFDITKGDKKLKEELSRQKKPTQGYDIVMINPPWIHAKKLKHESDIQGGVYDSKALILNSSIKSAGNFRNHRFLASLLRDKNSRIFLIYSDLSKNLGLEAKSVEQICKQNSLIISDIVESPLISQMPKPHPLNQIKQKSKIQLFEIRKSS